MRELARNLNWERTVIGTVLFDPHSFEAASANDLVPQDFSIMPHQMIWREVLALQERSSLSLRAVVESLRDLEMLESLGASDVGNTGEAYVQYLLTYRDSQGVEEAIKRVIDDAVKRQLEGIGALLQAEANSPREADEIVDEAVRRIYSLRHTRVETGVQIGEIFSIFVPRMEGMRNGEVVPAYIPQIKAIRDVVRYVDRTEYIVVAGRPGDGKSSVLRWEARFMAEPRVADYGNGFGSAISPKEVLTFNLENDELEYAKFAIAMESGIDSAKLKDPRLLTPEELERAKESARRLSRLPWRIVTLGGPSVREIERIATRVATNRREDEPDLGMIQVDYLQLIRNGLADKVENVSESSRSLRALALQLHVPVMAASQLSRNIEHRGELAEPELSDLRDSGSIEQDSTQVWFVRNIWGNNVAPDIVAQFPENLAPDGSPLSLWKAVPVRFYVRKNRNGPVGVSEPVKFVKSTNAFLPIVRDFTRR
jgi:replicative DNA helicase